MFVGALRGLTHGEVDRSAGWPGVVCGLLLASLALGCGAGSSGGSSGTPGGGTPGGGTGGGVYSGGDQPPTSTGTIAYAHGNELRLVEPDGSGDHLVFATPVDPDVSHWVTAPAWRPNGWEIAFSSDHEMAYSVFDRDIYAIRPDGVNLRRLTNAPTRDQAATYPKGTVRVTVQNDDVAADRLSVIVQGADPQGIVVPAGSLATITVTNVADLGAGVPQGVVAVYGTYRWIGPAVDVKAGQTVDAGVLYVHASSTVEAYGAGEPFWRSDASEVGYVGAYCSLLRVASNPPPGFEVLPLVSADAFFDTCPAEWGPTPATASQLIANDGAAYVDNSVADVIEMTEGATTKPPPVLSLDPYIQIVDLHWLRDGSGFLFARRNSELEYDVNVWEYQFATGAATQLTDVQLADGVMRRFSVSPDGQRIAFEVIDRLYGDDPFLGFCDLWVMNLDGSGQRLLAHDARYPAWNPQR